jgi:uncharacterized metal-binding protein YceD (DUF177 family)
MTVELHRILSADQIGLSGVLFVVDATEAECAALAARMQIPAVLSLHCSFRLTPWISGGFLAKGELKARVVRTCVVSMDDFETDVAESFSVRFVPAGTESEDVDPDDDDEIPFDRNVLDLGDAAAEQLALNLDPYPRRPDAALPEVEPEDAPHPFQALSKLRPPT